MDLSALTAILEAQSQQITAMQEAAKKRDKAYNTLFYFAETNISGPDPPPEAKISSQAKGKAKENAA